MNKILLDSELRFILRFIFLYNNTKFRSFVEVFNLYNIILFYSQKRGDQNYFSLPYYKILV